MKRLVNKQGLKRLVACGLFLLLAWQLFAHLTYLFRNTNSDRVRFVAFEENAAGSLDVVYIGASAVYVFWDPMCAWSQYGFTSYNYATSNMPAAICLPAIKTISKAKQPKLFLVDIRTFLFPYYLQNGIVNEGGYKDVVDAMDLSLERVSYIAYSCKIDPASKKDALSSIFDLIYYHNNLPILKDAAHWNMANNTTGNRTGTVTSPDFMGFEVHDGTACVAMFDGYRPPDTQKTAALPEGGERCLRELLEYCSTKHIPLLMTATPFITDENAAEQINEASQICDEYQIPFFNATGEQAWAEMNLDPRTDFYNADHVNELGAKKYSEYLANYLVQNYDLPDHRADPDYSSWWQLYHENYLPLIEQWEAYSNLIVEEQRAAIEDEQKMRGTNDAAEWLNLADNENITLLIAADRAPNHRPNAATSFALQAFGLAPYLDGTKEKYIGVYAGHSLYSDTEAESYAGDTATPKNNRSFRAVSYAIDVSRPARITVEGANVLDVPQEEIGIVAVDNNLLKVVDTVVLDIESDGSLSMHHLPAG